MIIVLCSDRDWLLSEDSYKADDSEEMSYVEFEQAAAENCAAITRYMIAH